MRTDLSDIAKHLIALMSESAYVSLDQIYARLPDADATRVNIELCLLVKSGLVAHGRRAYMHESVYWLLERAPGLGWEALEANQLTMADVGLADSCPPVSAIDLLSSAAKHMADRAATYDKPEGERSMGTTVVAFNAVTGRSITEAEGWLLLQLLKDVRLFQRPGYHADSAEDCIAYSALKAEAKSREQGAANE
jgi:hypothetical protein